MKFSSIHLDGFGTFSNRDIGPLGDGLNIVFGENEAGKSTLLDFVRGVLYGFTDRRSPKSFHEPLFGGKHGGSIAIRDEHGSIWTIERHVGQAVSITDSSGAVVSQLELSDLLGHTDRKVFESIFAFGLDELAEAERLHDESVRDLIFSAGVAGAGRSASLAIKRLEEERSEITKNSRSASQGNQLQHLIKERDELLEQLRLARAQSTSYLSLQREIDRLDRVAKSMFSRLSERENRGKELDDLVDAELSRQRRLALERDLAFMKEPSPAETRLTSRRQQIEELVIRADSFQRDVIEYERLSRELTSQRENIQIMRDRIGFKESQPTPRAITIGLQSEIGTLARDFQTIQLDLHAQSGVLAKAEVALERQRQILSNLTRDRNPAEFDDVATRLKELPTLRSMLASRRELVLADQLARRDRQPENRVRTGLDRMIITILGFVASFGLVAGVVHLTKPAHDSVIVALSGVAVFLASITGLALFVRQSHQQRTQTSQDHKVDENDSAEELAGRIVERARRLGIADQPTEAELEELEVDLRERERAASEIKLALDREQQCVSELNEATEELAKSEKALDELRARAARHGDELGLDQHVDPDVLVKIIDTIDDLVELEGRHQQELGRLPELIELIDTYENDLRCLCHEIERTVPDHEGYALFLTEVAKEADLSQKQITARDLIITEISTIDEILGSLTRRNSDGERLRDELERGSVVERELERDSLSMELEEIKSEIEQIVGQRRDFQNEINSLSSSSSIAELEIALATVEINITEIFDDWTLLTLSSSILKEALNRYEIERQPAVIERAGELFEKVTEGRYTKLSSHEDDQQRRSLRVIKSDGRGIDSQYLSKGTAEQLYLCVRLAYAMTFAERAVAMPLVFDDVLVNFDPKRCQQMARAIAMVADQHQVILFTCHPNIAETLVNATSHANTVTLDRLP